MSASRTGTTWIIAVLLAMPVPARSQSVSGQFTLEGRPFTPTEVAAFRARDRSAPRTTETYVVLTVRPVDRAAISRALDPYVAAINDEAVLDADFIALHVKADGQTGVNAHVGGTQYVDSSRPFMGQPAGLTAACRENTPTRVACTVKSAGPVKTLDGQTWTLDVTFETHVAGRAPGTPLPADGGAAGRALLDLIGAVEARDLSRILARLVPEEAQGYQEDWRSPAENLEAATDILGARLPKQPTVVSGELWADDRAVLDVEGVPFEGATMLYLVDMREIDGRWVYAGSISLGLLR